MPYELDCNKKGCYVVNTETGERKNKKRMPKFRANKYMRKLYQVESEKKEAEAMKEFFEQFLFSTKEKPMKSEGDGDHPASHYLVVEDPEKSTTWHLRVRNAEGEVDHRLMGAAWAALHGGYRGNKYEGPNKEEAISKLKKLYAAEDMEPPTEKELSIDDKLVHIRNQITNKFNPGDRYLSEAPKAQKYYWVQHLYEDYAILNEDSNYYRVDYSVDEEGKVIIGDLQKVEMAWVVSGKEDKEPLATFEEEPKPDISHLMVFKEASGNYRWIMFSSNAFQDRDGEIVSQKALEADVERANKDSQYGPLRWWHVGEPDVKAKTAGPGLDIGDCDFNEMHGKILVESGTFRDHAIGEMVAEKAAELQGSILFFHPQSEPDAEGVFHNIQRAERSLLPKGKASNSLVSLLVAKKELEMNILQEKWNKFVELVGETKVKEALEKAELTEKQAEALGFTSKDKEGQEPTIPTGEETPADGEPTGEGGDESFLGDMTPKQFQELQAESLKAILDPVNIQLKQIQDSQVTTKDTQTSLKEAVESQVKRLEDMDKRLKELEGETPRGQKGYRPSQDDETVIGDDHKLKESKPRIDPEFESFLFQES